jgi:hypothetical protein
LTMTLPPGLYSGTSSLALVARASAFGLGLVYGNMKLKVLKVIFYLNFVLFLSKLLIILLVSAMNLQ